jgi:hypothetical protein
MHDEVEKEIEPLYQHTADELRYVAEVLDVLNKVHKGPATIGFGGELKLWWVDRVMGTVALDDESDLCSWVYYPSSNGSVE